MICMNLFRCPLCLNERFLDSTKLLTLVVHIVQFLTTNQGTGLGMQAGMGHVISVLSWIGKLFILEDT